MDNIEEYNRYLRKCEMLGVKMFDFTVIKGNVYIVDYIENNEAERLVRIPNFVRESSRYAFRYKTQRIKVVGKGPISFKNYRGDRLNVSGVDTSEVTSMYDMFKECNKLKELDLSNFNTSNVRDMANMFNNCYKLEKINLSGLDTHRVEDMSFMFENCIALKRLDISSFDTSRVKKAMFMFNRCIALEELNMSKFNLSINSMGNMFVNCYKLKIIKTNEQFKKKLEYTRETTGLIEDCKIIVEE